MFRDVMKVQLTPTDHLIRQFLRIITLLRGDEAV